MKNIVILGAGGFGRECYAIALACIENGEDITVKGFLDDNMDALDEYESYPPIIGKLSTYEVQENDIFVCAIGKPNTKEICTNIIIKKGGDFINLIHPKAIIGLNCKMGKGCIMMPNTLIGQDVTIGDFVTFDGYSSVGHDVQIGSYTHLSPFAFVAGNSYIGNRVMIHPDAKVILNRTIGDDVTIGVGSVVIKNIKAGEKVFGNPAKKI
jgi:sugar O-acyltransferase (sialic acid O-acetyltransferase NeuD family)